ncbi:CarD family transcriptional regulator [Myxococcota bacterium]|nr:CarD family transcriptional regulator [Myxococcota bacterium]
MAFNIGDKAVYPNHGVGVIEGIDSREIAGHKQNFYVLRILENNMIVLVPLYGAASAGMREVTAADEIEKVFDILRERDVKLDQQTWNRRQREYLGRIKTGSIFEVARVLRDLSVLKTTKGEKNLSFGERKMFDNARNLLVRELAVAKDMSIDDADVLVAGLLGEVPEPGEA